MEQLLAQFLGVEPDVVGHVVERAGPLELLDGVSPLRHVEISVLERAGPVA